MRCILYVILSLVVVSCGKNSYNACIRPDELLVNEISLKVFLQLKKEKNLYSCGTGGEMMDEIKMLYLAFNYYNEVDVDQARELLMTAGKLFLNEINAEERIRQYLVRYPFEPENIEIAIFLKNSDGAELAPEKLHVISMVKGKLRYKIGAVDSRNYMTVICEETFEEAGAKLNAIAGASNHD